MKNIEKNDLLTSDELKIRLLDWLMSKKKKTIFANEVLFSQKRRRADLVCFNKNTMTAFEIKGDLDNTSKLQKQTEDYVNTFDKVFIVTTKKNMNLILKKIKKKNVGIIFYDGKFKIIREADLNVVRKLELLYLLDRGTLLKEMKKKKNTISTDDIRKQAYNTISLKRIKEMSYEKMFIRYQPLFKLFLKDRYKKTQIDDLLNLTGAISLLR